MLANPLGVPGAPHRGLVDAATVQASPRSDAHPARCFTTIPTWRGLVAAPLTLLPLPHIRRLTLRHAGVYASRAQHGGSLAPASRINTGKNVAIGIPGRGRPATCPRVVGPRGNRARTAQAKRTGRPSFRHGVAQRLAVSGARHRPSATRLSPDVEIPHHKWARRTRRGLEHRCVSSRRRRPSLVCAAVLSCVLLFANRHRARLRVSAVTPAPCASFSRRPGPRSRRAAWRWRPYLSCSACAPSSSCVPLV